jgi:hypothetical protein
VLKLSSLSRETLYLVEASNGNMRKFISELRLIKEFQLTIIINRIQIPASDHITNFMGI